MALPQQEIDTQGQCKSFDICSAPLCPLDESSLGGVWYPDEAVCTRFHNIWIRNQKRIALEYKRMQATPDTCYTLEMLKARGIQLRGLNPDSHFADFDQVKKYLRGFPK